MLNPNHRMTVSCNEEDNAIHIKSSLKLGLQPRTELGTKIENSVELVLGDFKKGMSLGSYDRYWEIVPLQNAADFFQAVVSDIQATCFPGQTTEFEQNSQNKVTLIISGQPESLKYKVPSSICVDHHHPSDTVGAQLVISFSKPISTAHDTSGKTFNLPLRSSSDKPLEKCGPVANRIVRRLVERYDFLEYVTVYRMKISLRHPRAVEIDSELLDDILSTLKHCVFDEEGVTIIK